MSSFRREHQKRKKPQQKKRIARRISKTKKKCEYANTDQSHQSEEKQEIKLTKAVESCRINQT